MNAEYEGNSVASGMRDRSRLPLVTGKQEKAAIKCYSPTDNVEHKLDLVISLILQPTLPRCLGCLQLWRPSHHVYRLRQSVFMGGGCVWGDVRVGMENVPIAQICLNEMRWLIGAGFV